AENVDVPVLECDTNVLISDSGIRGVVIRLHGGDVRRVPDDRLRVDAGVTINGFVRWTINRGFAGVEAWAGTPGTVGGAIHGNAHFKGRMIGELIESVEVATRERGLRQIY